MSRGLCAALVFVVIEYNLEVRYPTRLCIFVGCSLSTQASDFILLAPPCIKHDFRKEKERDVW